MRVTGRLGRPPGARDGLGRLRSSKTKLVRRLTVNSKIGIDTGAGHHLGNYINAVMVLRSSIGNRSLAGIYCPRHPAPLHNGVESSGYMETVKSKDKTIVKWKRAATCYSGTRAPVRRRRSPCKGSPCQHRRVPPRRDQVRSCRLHLFQGDKDRYNQVHAAHYGKNLQRLFDSLRKDFDALMRSCLRHPRADQQGKRQGQRETDHGRYVHLRGRPQNKGKAAVVYTHLLSMGSSSNGHYGGNLRPT